MVCNAAKKIFLLISKNREQALLVPNLAHQQIGWQARQCLADELPVMYKDIQQSVDREQKMRQKKR